MSGPVSKGEFDLLPDPRILPMLGEITLPQWRCLAEFIDNSVDAFLAATRSGHAITNPEILISTPTSDTTHARITVLDNGPGMDPETLEKAVRAGWTSNDPIHNLGMFGMGFNIATARLGSVTTVWTTREGDMEWHGLEIDFDALVRQRHFRTPRLIRAKIDPREHGTEVLIERLKPEQRQWFARAANRSKLADSFTVAYASMLRPNGIPVSFGLRLNSVAVLGRSHCVWGGEGSDQREVSTARYGVVKAFQPIQADLGKRSFCVKCWQWLQANEVKCPACDSDDNVVVRDRKIHGWLGIQRYLSETDYGVDFIRNGRKIEVDNKDLFSWDSGGKLELEYPIDDPRGRGRIVGEIHIDHCRVTYTKDRFDRNDPAWDEMVKLARGPGPLRPERAAELGFGPTGAPLFLLFQAFRRNNPHSKKSPDYSRLLVVKDNDVATSMAKRFYAGEAEYQTDGKWWDLVVEAEKEALTPPVPSSGSEPGGLEGFGSPPSGQAGQGEGLTEAPPQPPPQVRTPIASLSGEYREPRSSLRWDIRAYRVEPHDPALKDGGPWALRATPAGPHEFFIDTSSPLFRSATLTPLDALLSELASSTVDFLRNRQPQLSFAAALASLRKLYASSTNLDPAVLSAEALATITEIARSISKVIGGDDGRVLFNELTPTEQDAVHQRMAAREVRNPQKVLSDGRFLEFAPRHTIQRFFERHPELFFDGKFWQAPYSTMEFERPSATEAARSQLVTYYSGLIADAMWLADQDSLELEASARTRLLRAALALDLLARETEEPAPE